MRTLSASILLFGLLVYTNSASARLEVCNQTDLVLMVAVGYDTSDARIASEGWWRVYPGFCEVPVDVAFLEGAYYLHAESNTRSTMPGDTFTWGDDKQLCVELNDFRLPDARYCDEGKKLIKFNQINKNWRNTHVINITHKKRRYLNQFRVKIAGVQRLLSVLGYDVGVIDGVAGEKTFTALNDIGLANNVFGFDFKKIYPLLEQLIAQQQKLDN